MTSTVRLFDITVHNLNMSETIQLIENHIVWRKKITVIPLNVDMVLKALKDKAFFHILNNNNLVVFDGVPLKWAARLVGINLKQRINGTNLLVSLCELAAQNNYKLFFLGAAPGIAEKASVNLRERYKGLEIVGIYSPPFGFEKNEDENNSIIKVINDHHCDVLFVGFGAPKQEKWMHSNVNKLNVPVIMAVGGAFDFISGNIKRAPRWMQEHGFEWLHRLYMEPRRLWKRYLIGNPKFVYLALKNTLRLRILKKWLRLKANG